MAERDFSDRERGSGTGQTVSQPTVEGLGYFPEPYPEEIMYSLLARYSRHLGLRSAELLGGLLFGVGRRRRNIAFSSKLGLLASRLPSPGSLTPENMLFYHTVFPYYAAFMEPAKRAAAVASRIGVENPSTSFSANGWKWLRADNTLRFCPECVADMQARYGELYWRRDHQIPTVLTCPSHGRILLRGDMSKAGTRGWCAATPETCPADAPPLVDAVTEAERETLNEIAIKSAELLRGNHEMLSKRIDPIAYQEALVAKGLGWGSTFTDPVKLRNEFVKHFGHLGRIWPMIFDETDVRGSGAINRVAGSGAEMTDPIMHILVSMLLARTPNVRPAFGNGPWSCPNPLAAHDSALPVTRVVRTRPTEESVVGTFHCTCGYVYVCSESREGRVTRPIVKIFGETLRPLILKAISEKWAISRTAKIAGIGTGALVSQARALGFSCPWEVVWHQSTRKPRSAQAHGDARLMKAECATFGAEPLGRLSQTDEIKD